MNEQRDIALANDAPASRTQGRNLIAVIGIDSYQCWRPLSNAVNDVRGALALFGQLGFEQAAPPLIDNTATGKAIQALVADDLVTLGRNDSLVLFYAGHGANRKHRLGDQEVTTGYLIPVDAEDKISTWVDLEAWLRAVALLPVKHILVVLDSCNSGIALNPVLKWREASPSDEPLETLSARRSRRIITSALDGQKALDSGPMDHHSLFTGCLIEALTHGIQGWHNSRQIVTGSELGLHLQRRVAAYPHSQQTPDFGAFAFDERGEIAIPLMGSWQDDRTTSIVKQANGTMTNVVWHPPTTSSAITVKQLSEWHELSSMTTGLHKNAYSQLRSDSMIRVPGDCDEPAIPPLAGQQSSPEQELRATEQPAPSLQPCDTAQFAVDPELTEDAKVAIKQVPENTSIAQDTSGTPLQIALAPLDAETAFLRSYLGVRRYLLFLLSSITFGIAGLAFAITITIAGLASAITIAWMVKVFLVHLFSR